MYDVVEEFDPRYGYFLESTKSMLVVTEGNREKAEVEFSRRGFKVVGSIPYAKAFTMGVSALVAAIA